MDKYAAAVIERSKVVKHFMNGTSGKLAKKVFFPESWYSPLNRSKN